MSQLSEVKSKIKTLVLDPLVQAGTLKEIQVDDFSKRLSERDIGSFPAAILTSPSIESGYDTNASNLRTYTFVILVLLKAENVTDAAEVEDLMEAMLNQIDTEFGLEGEADGGVEPSISTPGPLPMGNKGTIAFTITMRVKATYSFR